MAEGIEKLRQDIPILAAMAEEMDYYLRSDVLFWPMMKRGLPKLTLGGYLMRQHRLLALSELLSAADQQMVDTAVTQFNQALVEKIVRFEHKANQELSARTRQWGEYLKDLQWEKRAAAANYRSAVETRVIITAVTDKLSLPPYQLDPRLSEQTALLDGNLRGHWRSGPFVWPEDWQPAYPKSEYWWLYGRVKG